MSERLSERLSKGPAVGRAGMSEGREEGLDNRAQGSEGGRLHPRGGQREAGPVRELCFVLSVLGGSTAGRRPGLTQVLRGDHTGFWDEGLHGAGIEAGTMGWEVTVVDMAGADGAWTQGEVAGVGPGRGVEGVQRDRSSGEKEELKVAPTI